MAHAGGREGRGKVAIDPVAQADQDPGRESGFGFGQHRGQRRGRAWRASSTACPASTGRGATSIDRAVMVPTAPIRSR